MKKPNILVFYIRISVNELAKHAYGKEESDSIVNQRALLWGYIGKKTELAGYEVMEICDDGYSGTNLNRPGMIKLLDMVKKGQVGCIVVKDFSRFGRNYLTVSDNIDQIFPFMGIRFISVNDHYDSATCRGATSGVGMAFRNIIYGYYSHDLSIKVKSGKRGFFKPIRPDWLPKVAREQEQVGN